MDEHRRRLANILGIRDERPETASLEFVATTVRPGGSGTRILLSNSPRALESHRGTSTAKVCCLNPNGEVSANVIAIPDAEQTPEWLAGSSYARVLASSGYRVVIPAIVSRRIQKRRNAELTDREFISKCLELGRHVTGYELQKIPRRRELVCRQVRYDSDRSYRLGRGRSTGPVRGGTRTLIDFACVSGYFGPREGIWEEPHRSQRLWFAEPVWRRRDRHDDRAPQPLH